MKPVRKTDENRIAMLKLAWFSFDKMYPSGPQGVENVGCRDIQPRSNKNDGNAMTRTTKCGGVATSNKYASRDMSWKHLPTFACLPSI